MKKISILFLILFLCSCQRSISKTVYVASMHFAKEDDEYIGSFYVINSLSIGISKQTNQEGGSIAIIRANTIAQIFTKLEVSSSLEVNLRHVASIIFDVSFLKDECIIELIDNIKNNNYLYYNSCVFVSGDTPKDIYNIKNPGGESDLHSIIISPLDRKNLYLGSQPITLLCFIRNFYNNYTLKIPMFSINDIWDTEGSNYYVDGVCFYKNNKVKILDVKSYPGLMFLDSHRIIQTGDDTVSFYLKKLQIKKKFNEKLVVDLFFYYDILYSNIDMEEKYIAKYILDELERLKELEIDFLNIEYLNKKLKKEYSYDDVVYSLRFKD